MARRGIANRIGPAVPSYPTGSKKSIRIILRVAGNPLSSGEGGLATGGGEYWRRTIHRARGARRISRAGAGDRAVPAGSRGVLENRVYFSTFTPFQNATWSLICFAAGFGSG